MTDPTAARILATALQAFDEKGLQGVTTAEICRRAAVSNGSLFHHFGSKDGIVGALYLSGIRAYQEAMRAALQAGIEPEAAVHAAVAAHQDWAEAEPVLARFLFDCARPGWPGLRSAEIEAENARFRRHLADWAAPHRATGRLLDLPVEVIAAQLIGPIQIFTRAWLSGRSAAPPARGPDGPLHALQAAAWRALRGPHADATEPGRRNGND
ncbi:MAG: TetR/AcrR family transcriptional regulator [Sneathiellaceae bacterium]